MNLNGIFDDTSSALGGAAAGAIVGLGTGLTIAGSSSKKRKRRKSKNTRRKSRRARRGRRTPRTAGKRRDTSHRRIRYTKNGQPYIILRSGKARFLKKSSAKRSHRLKGGRY